MKFQNILRLYSLGGVRSLLQELPIMSKHWEVVGAMDEAASSLKGYTAKKFGHMNLFLFSYMHNYYT